MKDFKYQDYKGFENLNTPEQFDQWEGSFLPSAKNRFVYDFSSYSPFMNLGYFGYRSYYGFYGNPGDLCQMVKPSGVFNLDTYNDDGSYDGFETTLNINNKNTLYFNEDTLAFTDVIYSGSFGSEKLANFLEYFRSGYVEFSIKTEKQNSVIASGSTEIDLKDFYTVQGVYGSRVEQGASITSLTVNDTKAGESIGTFAYPYYNANSSQNAIFNLNIEIVDGKIAIRYWDEYNKDDVDYLFIGHENVSDNKWHHIVVNFGRPGMLKELNNKFNKKYVEIWVDGSLDHRFDDKVNEFNIFYPVVKYLFNNPIAMYKNFVDAQGPVFQGRDLGPNIGYGVETAIPASARRAEVGFDEFLRNSKMFSVSTGLDASKKSAFKGAMHTFAHGVNIPISKFEIQERYSLWKEEIKRFAKIVDVHAEMINPTISSNSKKAIKLFWNNLTETGKFGVELDKNLTVDAYSVTHKSNDSKTKIYNIDIAKDLPLNVFTNVRAAFASNVLIQGPGMVMMHNTPESRAGYFTQGNSPSNWNPNRPSDLDVVQEPFELSDDPYQQKDGTALWGPRKDLPFSGIELKNGDRILLTNQIRTEENGIWEFNGLSNYLTRPLDAINGKDGFTNVVYVSDGIYKNTYWKLKDVVSSLSEPQKWTLLNESTLSNISSSPELTTRWKDYRGNDRFINLEEDLDISKYDVIVFMNYPEKNEDIFELFPNDPQVEVSKQYNDFLKSIQNVVSNGANLMVTSPKLAEDLGIVKQYEQISQLTQNSDSQAAIADPFEVNGDAARYFDTHRNNKYSLVTPVAGLTDKQTYILTDFINYVSENAYDYDEYHAKYSYRQFGLAEGNEFIIPGTALRAITNNENIPGYRNNYRGSDAIWAVSPSNVIAGTVVTQLANTYYNGSTVTNNPYDDYATTIIVHNGQILNGQPINGKIFVNCTEDSYTFSRQEYNKATIQVVDPSDPYETVGSLNWQYSTKRLNRSPQRVNVSGLTELGQTTPTNGGGGAFIQAPSNASNGVIRSQTDFGVRDRQSDLYATESEEIYPIQEIPVLSMTWLGLKWLEG